MYKNKKIKYDKTIRNKRKNVFSFIGFYKI